MTLKGYPTYRLIVSYLTRETCSVTKQGQVVTLYLLLSALLRFFLEDYSRLLYATAIFRSQSNDNGKLVGHRANGPHIVRKGVLHLGCARDLGISLGVLTLSATISRR